jgi:hypothetical protein
MKLIICMITGALAGGLATAIGGFGLDDWQFWAICAPVWVLTPLVLEL